jgi:starch phosphorylase
VAEDGGPLHDHAGREVALGEQVSVTAQVHLAGLSPGDVVVEAYHGALLAHGALGTGRGVRLELSGNEDGCYLYRGAVPARNAGVRGYAVRVLPHRADVLVPNELPLIAWEESEG